jgi:hypothetical protein
MNRSWIKELTEKQKELIIDMFSVGCLMGANHIFEYYCMYEDMLFNPYVRDVKEVNSEENMSEIQIFRQAIIKILPQFDMHYTNVKTEEELSAAIKDFYKNGIKEDGIVGYF